MPSGSGGEGYDMFYMSNDLMRYTCEERNVPKGSVDEWMTNMLGGGNR